MYQYLWDEAKAALRGNFIVVNTLKKKKALSQQPNFITQRTIRRSVNQTQSQNKIRAEINKIENSKVGKKKK